MANERISLLDEAINELSVPDLVFYQTFNPIGARVTYEVSHESYVLRSASAYYVFSGDDRSEVEAQLHIWNEVWRRKLAQTAASQS